MISVSPFNAEVSLSEDGREVKYLLRRADHESVAAIRATDPRARDSHAVLARHYGEQSRQLMAKFDEQADRHVNTPQS